MTKTMSPQADDAFRNKMLACTHVLNGMPFELQARYGAEAVVAAVMDVASFSVYLKRVMKIMGTGPLIAALRA